MPRQFHLRFFGAIQAALACFFTAMHGCAALAGAEPRRIAYTSITEESAATRPLPAATTPQRLAVSRLIRKLIASGFIDALYKGR